jgi:DNA-binding NarL/FixJ family response regulator
MLRFEAGSNGSNGGNGVPDKPSIPLTDRQIDVLRLLDRGLSNKEIGRELGVSERTVKAHMTAIFKSLGVSGRAEAIAMARRSVLL